MFSGATEPTNQAISNGRSNVAEFNCDLNEEPVL